MTFSTATRSEILILILFIGFLEQNCSEYLIGQEFLFSTFSLHENENQSILIRRENVDSNISVVIISSVQGLSSEIQFPLQKESIHFNQVASYSSFIIKSNENISLKGIFGDANTQYDIFPVSSLGTNYSLVYGLNFELSAAVCSITALKNNTIVSVKNPDRRLIQFLAPQNHTKNLTFVLEELEIIQFYGQNLFGMSIESSEVVSVVCGANNSINNVRVHLPPTKHCVTSYDVSCFDNSRVPSGETHIRIIKFYPLLQGSINIVIDGVQDNKTNQEKSIDKSFNVTADKPFCVRSNIRKWKNSDGQPTFVDDNYHIILDYKTPSSFCPNKSQEHNRTLQVWENGTARHCTCPCKATPRWYNLTEEKVAVWLQRYTDKIRRDLVLNKRELNSFIRQRISARDYRPSATGIGAVGVMIVCCVIGAIISCDCPRFWKSAIRLKKQYTSGS